MMKVERTIASMRHHVAGWRKAHKRIALVPTMGALHDGHLSLVREAKRRADRVVVSLFVNPTQFGPNEDYTRYPRDEESDARFLRDMGADLLYAPGVAEMYPAGARTTVTVRDITRRWEGEIRPGHFDGVATIVTKLLTQVTPDIALFGEKDYQQLQVIKRLTRDLDLPVEIIGCPIIRDEHGLALSSRNAYLSDDHLRIARSLNRILAALTVELPNQPGRLQEIIQVANDAVGEAGFDKLDYLAVCDPETLEPLVTLDRPARLLVAASVAGVRLLDNMAVSP